MAVLGLLLLSGCATKYDLTGADWTKPDAMVTQTTLDEMECVRGAREAGACGIWSNLLYLKPGTREHFLDNLARDWPAAGASPLPNCFERVAEALRRALTMGTAKPKEAPVKGPVALTTSIVALVVLSAASGTPSRTMRT